MSALYEQYRPRSWEDLAGQDGCRDKVAVLRRRGIVGRVFWVTGDSGTGKTTVARLLASEVADDFAVEEVDAQDVSMDRVREWERRCQSKPLGGGVHCFIVNEAHGLSSKVVSRLLTVVEDPVVQRTSLWVFTTTLAGQQRLFDGAMDANPFLSRAVELRLRRGRQTELDFAMRAKRIAEAEGLDGRDLSEYVDLVRRCEGNLRKVLQRIEAGEMMT